MVLGARTPAVDRGGCQAPPAGSRRNAVGVRRRLIYSRGRAATTVRRRDSSRTWSRRLSAVDHRRLQVALGTEEELFAEAHPHSAGLYDRGTDVDAQRRSDALDGEVAGRVPRLRRVGERLRRQGRRRTRVRRLLPGRHGCDDRPLARGHGARGARPARPRPDIDAAGRGRGGGERGARTPVRASPVAVHAQRDGRQPERPPLRETRHRAPEGARLQLLLPRHSRRMLRGARRRANGQAAGKPRPAGRSRAHDAGRRVQRSRGARARTRGGGRGLRAHRARADQHRHGPP